MKWVEPEEKATRIKTRFLFLPKKLQKTTRWLEMARWTQVYTQTFNQKKNKYNKPTWHDVTWVEDAMISKLEGQL